MTEKSGSRPFCGHKIEALGLRIMRCGALVCVIIAGIWAGAAVPIASGQQKAQTKSGKAEPPDLLTFANGAVPVRIGGLSGKGAPNMTRAMQIVDGNPAGFVLFGPAVDNSMVEFVYALPAATTFSRFAVPNVAETPSPTQTFIKQVKVYGSAIGAETGFELLAQGVLNTHQTRNEVTELTVVARKPVKWVRVELAGGINVERTQMYFEFSELIGNGMQEAAPLDTRFNGIWKRGSAEITLWQDGSSVTGCYDRGGVLTGVVAGNILRAIGKNPAGVVSAFVLSVAPDGSLRGVLSANGAPFRLYDPPVALAGTVTRCPKPAEHAPPGCGSVLYGINFDFDSAALRPDAAPVIQKLYDGLRNGPASKIVIEGHTSSEGADQYNLQLSQRRAQAVVDALVKLGIAANRISAVGKGETEPIAKNDDEAGRALNRRVEIKCL